MLEHQIEPMHTDEIIDGNEKDLSILQINQVLSGLKGKILTIADATIIDKDRVKYVKDLIRNEFANSANWLYEISIRDFELVKGENDSKNAQSKPEKE